MASENDIQTFDSLKEFYPFYLSEHADVVNRRLHFVGTSGTIIFLITLLITGNFWFLLAALVSGYGFAWVGHFFFERNKPATFNNPFYSLVCDFIMYKDIWTGRISLAS